MSVGDTQSISVGLFVLPAFSMMALSAVSEPLRAANRVSGRELYRWRLIGLAGEPVSSSSGFTLVPRSSIDTDAEPDMIVVVSSLEVAQFHHAEFFKWLRRLSTKGCQIGAASTGSVVLARAGLLDGYRSTIHWELMADFVEEFPRLEISPDLFVIDRDRFTCGGGTAGLDMMLALIGRQHGQPLAVAVAEQFLHTRIRQPTESQRMNILARYHITDGRLATAIAVMEQHVERPLPTEAVALRCGVSPRQLERLFLAALNNTPGRFYLELRLREARRLLTETSQSILQIALRCGFASPAHFGKCYREAFKDTPARSRSRQPGRQEGYDAPSEP